VIAPFPRLIARGYLALLLAAAPRLAVLRARHGVKTLGDLRRLVEAQRSGPREWEVASQPGSDRESTRD